PCLPGSYSKCPVDATGVVTPSPMLGGIYYCNQVDLPGGVLQFPNGFSIAKGGPNDGVVEIYVIPTDNSNLTVSIAGTDPGANAPNPTDCTTQPSPCGVNSGGDPTKLRVYLANGTIDPGNGAGTSGSGDFTGILYAPMAANKNPSCMANWRGSITIYKFTCNG